MAQRGQQSQLRPLHFVHMNTPQQLQQIHSELQMEQPHLLPVSPEQSRYQIRQLRQDQEQQQANSQQQQQHQSQPPQQQQQQQQPPQPQQQQQQQQQPPPPQQLQHYQQPPRPNFQMALLPPPQDRLYNTWDDLREDVKAFAKSQGYAVVIISSLNRDLDGQYRRYNLCCAKGGKSYTSHARGLRNSRSTKTGCPMRMKAIQEKAWPYNDKWHVIVQCAEHNHEPFTGVAPGQDAPPQFRKIDEDGRRWLMVMHREAQCNLRQLTIGIRISFGNKYQYVKKSDVRNMLAKFKREEERKAAAAAIEQGLPSNAPYTLIPASHLPPPPPPPPQPVERMPALPAELQVPDPDLESDDDGDDNGDM